MNQAKKKPTGGGKLNRTQTVTMRLDPQLRYLTDLAARMQRRTTSGFIEWAIGEALDKVVMRTYDDGIKDAVTLSNEAYNLWDVDEADRFVKLAINYPQLLTYEEQIIWKIVREKDAFWDKGSVPGTDASPNFMNKIVDFIAIRKYWGAITLVATGEKGADFLPVYVPGLGACDEIPF